MVTGGSDVWRQGGKSYLRIPPDTKPNRVRKRAVDRRADLAVAVGANSKQTESAPANVRVEVL